MNEKLERTSRVSQEQKPKRNKPWTPPSSLDAPPAPKGFKHRWIRTEFMGQEDTGNVSKKLREGWEFNSIWTFQGAHWGWRPCVGKDT